MSFSQKYIIFLADQPAPAVQDVGGKVARLAALKCAGYPVPPGICLTTSLFRHGLRPYQAPLTTLLQTPRLAEFQVAKQVAKEIATLLHALKLPANIYETLLVQLPQIIDADTAVAVRSSATDEDGALVSFAGQYTTTLGVHGQEAIEQAILDCWRSFFSAHALAHRAQAGKSASEAAMAVLLQPFINADCAGVAYSIDPVTQEREHIMVNAVWGLGTGVVDGTIANDTDWVQRTNWQVQKRHIVSKTEQIKLNDRGQLSKRGVPDGYGRSACLPPSWLKRIAQFAVTLEQFFACPQDVEWAIADHQLWILQSRPLTALPPELAQTPPFPINWQNNDHLHFWHLAYYKAHQQEVPLPLEYDYFVVQESIREEACRLMGVEQHMVMQKFNGRPYFRDVPIAWTEADRHVRHQALNDQRDRLFDEGRTVWDVWGPEVIQATKRLRAFDFAQANGPTLADHLEQAVAVQRRHSMLHPLCDWRPRAAYFAAYTAVTGQSGPAAENAATQLLDGEDTPLTQLIDALYNLGYTARNHAALTGLLGNRQQIFRNRINKDVADSSGKPQFTKALDFGKLSAVYLNDPPAGSAEVVLAQLAALSKETAVAAFKQQFVDLLAVYGERVGVGYGSQATICTPTWQEAPVQFLRMAALYLDPEQEAPVALRARSQKERDKTIATLCAASDDPQAVAEFRRLLRNGRRWWTVLENHNHYIDQMACGQLRQAVMAAARWLVDQGSLPDPKAVFWLNFAEIIAALRAPTPHEFTSKIKARQAEHVAWTKLTAPSILGCPVANLPQRPSLADDVSLTATAVDTHIIHGLGASAGQVTGRARVMTDMWAWPELTPGDILVAHNIGPRWTPLFPLLRGLVLDSGSVGQHAAATAREYGVTAVIATGNATHRITDGSTIRIDGTKGLVWLQPKSD